ncbi:S24 family peptidase [Pararoseomonas sp. SCSIO 73927]|uniref:S24 family peptidase n=1 Tax=Pararoseomonas sp. SCSIO 73927 TaxID=3114537 RepID=UPI0030D028EC
MDIPTSISAPVRRFSPQVVDVEQQNRSGKAMETSKREFPVRDVSREVADRAERLRQAVREAGGNRAVAAKSGVPVGTIDNYVAGRDMRASNVARLAEATSVSIEWLLTGNGPRNGRSEVLLPPATLEASRAPPGYVSIPRYEAHASAGSGAINPTDRVIEQITVTEEYIRRVLGRQPKHMALLEALGDSMAPTIESGDILMIDVSVLTIRFSSVYVIRLAEQLLVKRLQLMFNGTIKIISDNPLYGEETVDPRKDQLDVVGEVVWSGGKIRVRAAG